MARKLVELTPWIGLCVALVVAQAWHHGWLYAASDDPYIYLGYVKRTLTSPHQLFSYNPGEHSAGTTGILYYYLLIPVCGVVRLVTAWLPLERSLLLGLYATNAVLFVWAGRCFLDLWRTLVARSSPATPAQVAGLFLLFCAHPQFLWGAFSGLENPLYTALSLFLFDRLVRRAPAWQPAVVAALLGATRPETLPILAAIPLLAAWVERRGAPVAVTIPRGLAALAIFAGSLVLLVLPFYAATGLWFPGALGTRVAVPLLSSPELLPQSLARALSLRDYWSSEWLVYTWLSLGVAGGVALARRGFAPLGLAAALLLLFAVRAVFGLVDFNIEDRYVSHLWPLFALVFAVGATVLARAAAPLAGRLGEGASRRASWAAAFALVTVAALLPIRDFLGRFDHHVRLMDQIVVQPSLWMREHLPPGSRVCMEPAGAIRVFTDFYLVDVVGLTTMHRHEYRGDYVGFLRQNRIDYVFDRLPRTRPIVETGIGREIKAWAVGVRPWGDIRLYELDAEVDSGA